LNLDHQVALVRAAMAGRESLPEDWQAAAFSTESWLRLSAAELAELAAEMVALVQRWAKRDAADDGQEREPVFVFAHGVPAKP
jgi:hypothetical protein